jgi:hypothetical protein
MKSIEARFRVIKQKNPNWGSLICYAEAVYKQGFNRETILRWFSLVDKEDYMRKDKTEITDWLENISRRG